MIYELRIYRALPGRMPALLKRFETQTLRIWEKHGIRQAGFWTTLVGESNNDLTYLLAWDSLAEREKPDRRQHSEFVPAADRLLQRALARRVRRLTWFAARPFA